MAAPDPCPDDPRSTTITLKAGLRGLLNDPDNGTIEIIITEAACNVSALTTRALQLVKLHLLDCHARNETLPKINYTLMLNALKVVGAQPKNARKVGGVQCKRARKVGGVQPKNARKVGGVQRKRARKVGAQPGQGKSAEARKDLATLYTEHYQALLPADDVLPSYKYLGDALGYVASSLVASFETNIKQHYVQFVEGYVNAAWDKRGEIERIRARESTRAARDAAVSAFVGKLRAIKTDLMRVGRKVELGSPSDAHAWVREHRVVVLPRKRAFVGNQLAWDLERHPQDYIAPMLRMTAFLEARGARLSHVSPLRTSVVPMHITIDTTTLVRLLFNTGCFNDLHMCKSDLIKQCTARKDEIWSCVFRTNRRIFHATANYAFDHMIRTDGVSCCVMLARKDAPRRRKMTGPRLPKRKRAPEKYVDELTDDEREALKGKRIIGIDPGMGNLLYCSTEDGTRQFRYTQNQRRKETKSKRYAAIELEVKQKKSVDGRTIVEWEATLSTHNFKTVNVATFKECIRAKLLVNSKTAPFYKAHLFRKMKLNGYFNRKRSETRMLQRMEATLGAPGDVVIGMGDWEQYKHRKFKEPTKGKGFRETLRRGGYNVLLVDEYRTSVQCSRCQHEDATCHTFLPMSALGQKRRRPELTEEQLSRHVYGLLLCQQCGRRWKRDENGSINMARLSRRALAGEERPEYLRRSARQDAARSPRKRKRVVAEADHQPMRPKTNARARPRLLSLGGTTR